MNASDSLRADRPELACSYPDHLSDAITVLENMRVTTAPMAPHEMGDIEQRRITALDYLLLERDRRVSKATCEAHRLDGYTWTCPRCNVAEAERREEAMRHA